MGRPGQLVGLCPVLLTLGLHRADEGAQRLGVGASPTGALRLVRILVRIDESTSELLEPVRADEADKVARPELELEATAVLAIQLVTALALA